MDVDVNDSVNLDGYHKFECSMENSFKTILSMMKEKNGGDLLDISRLALRVITNSPLKYHKVNSELDHNCLDSDLKTHGILNLVSHDEKKHPGML